MSKQPLYKVVFMSQGQVYEVYARSVGQGDLFGFVVIEELVFGERTTVVVDPGEERIKSEFKDVRRTYLPMHSIIRIDGQGLEVRGRQRCAVPHACLHARRRQQVGGRRRVLWYHAVPIAPTPEQGLRPTCWNCQDRRRFRIFAWPN